MHNEKKVLETRKANLEQAKQQLQDKTTTVETETRTRVLEAQSGAEAAAEFVKKAEAAVQNLGPSASAAERIAAEKVVETAKAKELEASEAEKQARAEQEKLRRENEEMAEKIKRKQQEIQKEVEEEQHIKETALDAFVPDLHGLEIDTADILEHVKALNVSLSKANRMLDQIVKDEIGVPHLFILRKAPERASAPRSLPGPARRRPR